MSKYRKRSGRGFYIIAAVLMLTVGIMARMSAGLSGPQKSEQQEPSSSVVSEVNSKDESKVSSVDSAADKEISSEAIDEPAEKEDTADDNPTLTEEEAESPEDNAERVAAEEVITFAMPLRGDIGKGFDTTRLQYSKTYGDMRLHTGIDIIGDEGTPVKASADGRVKSITTDPIWGTTVVLEHSGGIETHYCGLNDTSLEKGQEVKMNRIVGTIGKIPAECLDEAHLHFAVKQGEKWLSPLEVMGLD